MEEHAPTDHDVLPAALAWCAAGASVVRAATDGTKAPLGQWKQAQHEPANADTIRAWFATGHPGLGLVCGAVSGNLEMLELEGRAVADGTGTRFFTALDQHGLGDVKNRILAGYTETSPSGGIHLLYRVTGAPVAGNTKLAQRPNPDTDPKRVPLIETRGTGGFVIVAPSHGPVHPGGKPWTHVTGAPGTLATITADERDALHSIARLFDELPPPPPIPDPTPPDNELRPGTDYNNRATWDEILTPAGWTVVSRHGDRTLWCRPGKTLGVSAVTGGPTGDYLYVWTTSTELPPETGISKWRAYALLHHGGDFTAAAKALGAAGYGTPRPAAAPTPARPVFTVLSGGLGAALAPEPAPASVTLHDRTDDALAHTLVDTYGTEIRYSPERGRWLVWADPALRWCPVGGGGVREHVKTLARQLPDTDAGATRFRTYALSASGTSAILTQAATDPRIIVRLTDLDARPHELNTPHGIVDLRTGTLTPADPAHLHTRVTTHAPDTDADPSVWNRFLAETFAGHDDLPGYVQRLVGYSASGIVKDHVLPFCYGEKGDNGKTVFLETISAVLGDYATSAPAGFLMTQTYVKHETELADLAGARFVVCAESNKTDSFDEARVKALTGGDTIKARFMRQDYFTFAPTHHLWLMANHQPTVAAGGTAFWRRMRIIPFDNHVPPARRIGDFAAQLAGEHGGGIMAWIVAGAADYFRGGLREPATVHAATGEYEHDQDSVTRFVEDCCRVGGGDAVRLQVGVLRAAYERWCRAEDVAPVSARALTLTLRKVPGVASVRTNTARLYTGITLTAAEASGTDDGRERHDWWDR